MLVELPMSTMEDIRKGDNVSERTKLEAAVLDTQLAGSDMTLLTSRV